jgi:hypothetical protein
MQWQERKIFNTRWDVAFRGLIIAACLGVVLHQLFAANKLTQTLLAVRHNWPGILLIVLLVPLNWLAEAIKWKQFFSKGEATTPELLKSVLVGLCVGTITPWRTGEFPGRVLYLPADLRIKALHTSLLGGLAQAIITLCAGISFVFLFNLPATVAICAVACIVVALLIYFSFERLGAAIGDSDTFRFLHKLFPVRDSVALGTKLRVLLIAFMRYTIYCAQWMFALQVCGIDKGPAILFSATATILLIHSIAPAFPLFDFAIRTGIAVFVCGFICDEPILASVAATLIWCMNIAIPTMAGAVLLAQPGTAPQLIAEEP